jgi:predicted helicase
MDLNNYIESLNQRYKLGNATEHTFRGDLQLLLESLLPDVRATNEPKRQKCGAPDYILTKNDIPVGFIEAKDIGDKDLEGKNKSGNKEQFERYKSSLNNLIFTDYLDFHIYQDGNFIIKIAVAEVIGNEIKPIPKNFEIFTHLIKDFTTHTGQTIKSSKKLAEMMAGKARLLSDVIEKSLTSDETHEEDSTLKEQMKAFKDILIHDITSKGFADVYAQTIAYGMFAARLYDPTLENFSRQEAAELIPKSNPFLRKLFGYIAGPDIDDRIKWIVDNLAEIFLACNVEEILKNYGESTKMEDPIIHFYENFLAEYDPKLRKARGVWYTPAPVVNFIVRAVDDILKTEFDLPNGLADSSKTKVTVNTQTPDKRSSTGYKQIEKEFHKVQILDPATGTGTFLAEVIKHVNKKFKGQEGIWSSYVENDLIPRLNGFELLMASYAMAHLQLHLLLKETGLKGTKNQRTKIYLTNSLEQYHPDTGTLFANWLSSEANEANHIKRDSPVMCIIGNPPYSGISSNNGKWISDLIEDYKYVDGEHFKERKHWLNDDYVKFIRYGQHFVEKNSSGILAFINPHGFLDNPTFRGMRWNLLKTYDKIYTIDLHGNTKKKEVCPDGSLDQNVFDIMQGVAITIFVKTGKKKSNVLGEVFHYDLYGKRNLKYDFLLKNNLGSLNFEKLKPQKPFLFFVPKNNEGKESYDAGFGIDELFPVNVTGIVTARDSVVIDMNENELLNRINKFTDTQHTDDEIRNWLFPNKKEGKYLIGDSRGWKLAEARNKIQDNDHKSIIKDIDYRPFDTRKIYYSADMVDWGREKYMQHIVDNKNYAFVTARQSTTESWSLAQISKNMIDNRYHFSYKGIPTEFPLYLYTKIDGQQIIEKELKRKPNLNQKIVNEVAIKLDSSFTNEKEDAKKTFAPIDILDYIYAVLHSPTYREKYKEFLKIDFPRVPYPKDEKTFWELVKLGKEVREIHLLDSPKVEDYITSYPIGGSNTITTKIAKKDWEIFDEQNQLGRIWINEEQYFDSVPLIAWEFYIGGYQPAQKWLKDRKGRELKVEDILHYQKIIVALSETSRMMQEIDTIEIE